MPMICRVDKLKNIDGSVVAVVFELTEAESAAESDMPPMTGSLFFHGQMENRERVIKVTGQLECVLRGLCDRCGTDVMTPLQCDFEESFTNLKDRADEEEAMIHFFEGDTIDLLPYVAQAIFLNMPMKTLCREDCKGLCSECGINLNEKECSCDKSPIDPRLAVLADLLNKG